MGTLVIRGSGEAIVIATGNKTQSGNIALETTKLHKPKTPLEQQIIHFTKISLIGISIFIFIIFITGILFGNSVSDMLINSISLAVAAIPEGLPLLVTVVMAFGVHKMSDQKALVRKQNAIEVLGQVKTLITDKTGTLTKNSISPSNVILPNKNSFIKIGTKDLGPFMVGLSHLTKAIWLVTKINHRPITNYADPVDKTLLIFAQKYYLHTNKQLQEVLFEIPFSSEYKYSATCYKQGANKVQIYVKGSHQVITKFIANTKYSQTKRRFNPKQNKQLLDLIDLQSHRGEKNISFAECIITMSEFL